MARVEGYQIVTRYKGIVNGSIGSYGDLSDYPAMSKELAESKITNNPQQEDFVYELELLPSARFVETLAGVVIDNLAAQTTDR